MTKQDIKIDIETKNKIDKEPVVCDNARKGSDTPGARPANRTTANIAAPKLSQLKNPLPGLPTF